MGSVRQRLLRLRCAIPILATAFTLVALPGVAAAVPPPPTAVSYASGTGLRIVDGPGASSNFVVTFVTSPARYTVRATSPFTPVAPCVTDPTPSGSGQFVAHCDVTGSKLITAELGGLPNVLNGACAVTSLGDMIVSAGSGNDVLNGGPGFDLLKGEGGNDTLAGCAGDDVLEGGRDNDRLTDCKQPSTAVVPALTC
jgi:Ca2+-binding RTX toxin-like protein